MMEEWHQKLHNNTTPDDVIICQAIINYLRSNCDMGVYWETLNKEGKSIYFFFVSVFTPATIMFENCQLISTYPLSRRKYHVVLMILSSPIP